MIFLNSEINDIDLEALFFRIFKIPAVKFGFSGKMCFASKIVPLGQYSFYRDHSF